MAGDEEGKKLFVCSRVSKPRGNEKPRVWLDRLVNLPNWAEKKLKKRVKSGDEGVNPERDSRSKSGRP
jgi:hypothetical protein